VAKAAIGASVAERLARLRRSSLSQEEGDRAPEHDDSSAPAAAEAEAPANDTVATADTPEQDPVTIGDDTVTADAASEAAESTLSPSDEAALQAELAAIEAEHGTGPTPPSAAQLVSNAPEPQLASQDSMRLFDATDSRMAADETTRRRANIEHLKAAVAARSADARLSPTGTDGADATANYRSDLAEAIQPRRVRVDTTRRAAKTAPPLVLVSEQRIDDEAAPLTLQPDNRIDLPQPTPEDTAADGAGTEDTIQSSNVSHLADRTGQSGQNHDAAGATQDTTSPSGDDRPGSKESHADRFALELENSDAAEVEDVILLAAEYFHREINARGFKRHALLRLITEATDNSIEREEILSLVRELVDNNIMERDGTRYGLKGWPAPEA
jgi:hypothetical protein